MACSGNVAVGAIAWEKYGRETREEEGDGAGWPRSALDETKPSRLVCFPDIRRRRSWFEKYIRTMHAHVRAAQRAAETLRVFWPVALRNLRMAQASEIRDYKPLGGDHLCHDIAVARGGERSVAEHRHGRVDVSWIA